MANEDIQLHNLNGFDWDKSNLDKNWGKHKVAFFECEQVFFRQPIILPDIKHSYSEPRFFALGVTLGDRYLTLVFTIRQNKIRIISARPMSKKEKMIYEKTKA